MIEIIKAAFNAGEIKTFLIQGEYLEILEAAYPIDVFMMDRSGAQLSTMRNAEVSYFSRPGKYEVIQVQSPAAQTVRIFVGSGDAGTRKTSGDVSVIDGGKSRSIAGGALTAHMYSAAEAGMFTVAQLWNPIGSGKNIIVGQIIGAISGGFSLQIKGTTVALPAPNSQNVGSKKIGGPIGVALARVQSLAASVVNPANFAVSSGIVVRLTEPFVLPPGTGLNFGAPVANNDAGVDLEYFEEAI